MVESLIAAPRSVRMFGAELSPDDLPDDRARRSAEQVSRHLASVFDAVRFGAPPAPAALAESTQGTIGAIAHHGAQAWIRAVGHIDERVFRHSLMVAGLMSSLLLALRLRRSEIERLVQGALLHDIGKVRIPQAILDKPGPLDAAETAVMRTHPLIGEEIAQGCAMHPTIRRMIRGHHEHLDGTGYPDGLSGAQIPNPVRALTVCDILAALLEPRAYKRALPPDEAFAQMTTRRDHLDRELMAILQVGFDHGPRCI